jgi:hypothetical protein
MNTEISTDQQERTQKMKALKWYKMSVMLSWKALCSSRMPEQ